MTTRKAPAKTTSKKSPTKPRSSTKTTAMKKSSPSHAKDASTKKSLDSKVSSKKTTKKAGAPKLLSGGNPQIAKADGDAPVQAYIAALPGWKSETGKRIDAIITRAVPGVRKAVKWNSPFYGASEKSFFLSFHAFSKYLKISFFNGTSLRPLPPGESKHAEVRYLDLHESDALDVPQFEKWVKRAATLPGWTP